ncbi:hypothetical protein RJZ56_001777 [Blastomyces dermatitidis]
MPAFVVNFEGASLDSGSFSRNKLSFERERFGKTPVGNPRVHDNLPKPYEIIWSGLQQVADVQNVQVNADENPTDTSSQARSDKFKVLSLF